jgi:hypothetical protein
MRLFTKEMHLNFINLTLRRQSLTTSLKLEFYKDWRNNGGQSYERQARRQVGTPHGLAVD